ncbi:hypothetical protein HPB48_011865 [Haemaphysalis longicornis]|uniref:Uncharacterized protein n=1 Tax=Haemaphysalis longicornis TaxID=44386 RepID=A0A9J6FK51_HAELO|nr:hypothetical protein HPB48_011865 [Haemaphysalis longicornis]
MGSRRRGELCRAVVGWQGLELILALSSPKHRLCVRASHCVSFRRQMLLCRVTLGKSFLQFSAMKMAHAPPGHHSVIGRPSVGGLSYPEYVVYRGEQVRVPACW